MFHSLFSPKEKEQPNDSWSAARWHDHLRAQASSPSELSEIDAIFARHSEQSASAARA